MLEENDDSFWVEVLQTALFHFLNEHYFYLFSTLISVDIWLKRKQEKSVLYIRKVFYTLEPVHYVVTLS